MPVWRCLTRAHALTHTATLGWRMRPTPWPLRTFCSLTAMLVVLIELVGVGSASISRCSHAKKSHESADILSASTPMFTMRRRHLSLLSCDLLIAISGERLGIVGTTTAGATLHAPFVAVAPECAVCAKGGAEWLVCSARPAMWFCWV